MPAKHIIKRFESAAVFHGPEVAMGRHYACTVALAGSIPAGSTISGHRRNKASALTGGQRSARRFKSGYVHHFVPTEGMQAEPSEGLSRWFDSTWAHHADVADRNMHLVST